MRLTQLTDYALRLLIYLARHPERLCTIAEVAGSYGISETHMMKVTHQLGLAGWITTTRGKGGGIRLARDPEDIPRGAVVRSEPDFLIVECFSTDGRCTLTGNCKLAGVLDGALHSFMQNLDSHTLASILPAAPVAAAAHVIRHQRQPRARPA